MVVLKGLWVVMILLVRMKEIDVVDTQNTLKNTIENIKISIELYRSYLQQINPYNNLEISEFGQTCDVDIINQIENVCFDKNIGISYRF